MQSALHKTILIRILADMYADPMLGSALGFKGGTAAYLFYGLDRFSVDLDFDLLDTAKQEYAFEKIGSILKAYGTIRQAQVKKQRMIFVLSYDKKEQRAQNIKVEINFKDFGSRFELKSYMGISMLVMAEEDMFAHKLVAMIERLGKTNRDIYDVWFFSKQNWRVNKKIVEQRSGLSFSKFLQQAITSLEGFNAHTILDGLGELLTEKQKQWVRLHLQKEVVFSLRLMLNNEQG